MRATEPHHRQLYGVALALCRDPDQASDLTQEALIKAYKAFHRFRDGAPMLPWLRRILKNVYLDTLKTGRARHEVAERDLGKGGLPEPRGSDPDALAKVEQKERASWLREELEGLSEEHQRVLELCVMQDMSFAEVAEIMEVPVGTVASRVARARDKLRSRLERRGKLRR